MKKIEEWIEKTRTSPYASSQALDLVEQFVIHGDSKILDQLRNELETNGHWFIRGLEDCVPIPIEYDEEEKRAAAILIDSGLMQYRLRALVQNESQNGHFEALVDLMSNYWSEAEILYWVDDNFLGEYNWRTLEEKKDVPEKTPPAEYALKQSDKVLKKAIEVARVKSMNRYSYSNEITSIPWVFYFHDRKRLIKSLNIWLPKKDSVICSGTANAFLATGEAKIVDRIGEMAKKADLGVRLSVGKSLYLIDPNAYRSLFEKTSNSALSNSDYNNWGSLQQVLEGFGVEGLDFAIANIKSLSKSGWHFNYILSEVKEMLGAKAVPFFRAVFDLEKPEHSIEAVSHLIDCKAKKCDDLIEDQLHQLIAEKQAEIATKAIQLAGNWKPELFEDDLWKALGHRSKVARETAARALSNLGDSALGKGRRNSGGKKGRNSRGDGRSLEFSRFAQGR